MFNRQSNSSRVRVGAVVPTLVVVALVAAGCGSSPRSSTVSSTASSTVSSTMSTIAANPAGAPAGAPSATTEGSAATTPAASIPAGATAIPGVIHAAPDALTPVVSPARAHEGAWTVLASTGQGPVVWSTTIRPFADQPAVIATYAAFDQNRLHAALFNGTELPGGGPWTNGSTVTSAALPALTAAFNGGFKFRHIKGGYFTEGRVMKPLLAGEATLAIGTDGRMKIGLYGTDLTNDGSWSSLRQNLPLIIDGGHETVSTAHEDGVPNIYWGNDFGGVLLDYRSALCQRADGMLMYAAVGRVDINGLTRALLSAGCQRAMELDMNGHWPQFITYTNPGTASRAPIALDSRMAHLDRYTSAGSTKDFIALFDPALLPNGVVR